MSAARMAYGVEEAAETLCISKATVWRYIKEKQLQTFKLGARTLIRADVLSRFIDQRSSAA